MPDEPASPIRSLRWIGLPVRALAGERLSGCTSVAIDLEAEGQILSRPGTDSHAFRAVLPASVVLSTRTGSRRTVFGWLAAGSVRDRFTVQELERQGDARAADGGRVGDGRALEAGIAGRVEELGNELAEVGADDRHELLVRRP